MSAKARPAAEKTANSSSAIADYAQAQSVGHAAICNYLRAEIDAASPGATSKIWHSMPVWFIGENPVVGYKSTPKHVNLLFWNGQSFNEPSLQPAGEFRAAQIQFTGVSQIDGKALRRWMGKARTEIWDYAGLRAGNK
jgi:hypothetical protein